MHPPPSSPLHLPPYTHAYTCIHTLDAEEAYKGAEHKAARISIYNALAAYHTKKGLVAKKEDLRQREFERRPPWLRPEFFPRLVLDLSVAGLSVADGPCDIVRIIVEHNKHNIAHALLVHRVTFVEVVVACGHPISFVQDMSSNGMVTYLSIVHDMNSNGMVTYFVL